MEKDDLKIHKCMEIKHDLNSSKKKSQVRTYLETSENKKYQKLWDAVKGILWGKFIAVNTFKQPNFFILRNYKK